MATKYLLPYRQRVVRSYKRSAVVLAVTLVLAALSFMLGFINDSYGMIGIFISFCLAAAALLMVVNTGYSLSLYTAYMLVQNRHTKKYAGIDLDYNVDEIVTFTAENKAKKKSMAVPSMEGIVNPFGVMLGITLNFAIVFAVTFTVTTPIWLKILFVIVLITFAGIAYRMYKESTERIHNCESMYQEYIDGMNR